MLWILISIQDKNNFFIHSGNPVVCFRVLPSFLLRFNFLEKYMEISIFRRAAVYALSSSLLLFASISHANSVTSDNGTAVATLTIQNDWGGGYCAAVTVANNGSAAVSSWQVTLNLANSQINNLWNGQVSGNTVNGLAYNNTINAGNQTSFGFCADVLGSNYLPTLTALVVSGGGSASSVSSVSSVLSVSSVSSVTSSDASSSESSSSDSSSSISSAVSSSSSSVGGGNVIPNAAGNGWPYCRTADSDPDGDGWGWENSHSCIVYGSAADPGPGSYPYCMIGASQLNFCAVDNGSWGSESGQVCLSQSMCPGFGSTSQDPLRDAPVNDNANTTTQNVYSYLKSIWGEYMLSGQQDLTWQDNIDQYQRVINDTGRAPAIMGYDFMNYGLWAGNPGLLQTEEAITHWNRGGLVTFAWHWRDPDASDLTIGEFYTDSTDFVIPIANGVLDTSSPSFASIQADVALIAAELLRLQNAGVTVLWRPLHEASGGWFWWGRSDRTDGIPPAYAQVVLWRYLYDRLTNHYGLNNLIWVWNGQSAAWYPGDEYVDIVSYDIYDGNQNYESQLSFYNLTSEFPQERKMVALSENSNIPDPDLMAADGAWWLYFVVWNDTDTAEGVTSSSNFWTGEYYNTNAHKIHVYNHERVITLDELPDFD